MHLKSTIFVSLIVFLCFSLASDEEAEGFEEAAPDGFKVSYYYFFKVSIKHLPIIVFLDLSF